MLCENEKRHGWHAVEDETHHVSTIGMAAARRKAGIVMRNVHRRHEETRSYVRVEVCLRGQRKSSKISMPLSSGPGKSKASGYGDGARNCLSRNVLSGIGNIGTLSLTGRASLCRRRYRINPLWHHGGRKQ